jgi:hypothetical protein
MTDKFWKNPYTGEVSGPFNDEELEAFLAKGDVIDFDIACQKILGPTRSSVFRNHRTLRLLGLIKRGVYQVENKNGPMTAA